MIRFLNAALMLTALGLATQVASTSRAGSFVPGDLLVSVQPGFGTQSILAFSGSGGSKGTFASGGALNSPGSMAIGPDGALYVINARSPGFAPSILEYNVTTGAFIRTFVPFDSFGNPQALTFGSDGTLYVSTGSLGGISNAVLAFNGSTGSFLRTFVASGSGGLDDPEGMKFGPDGNLYVSSFYTHNVLRYDGRTGAFIDAFATAKINNQDPADITFGPNGDLYVAYITGDTLSHPSSIVRYDGKSGAFLDMFATSHISTPVSIAFGPDNNLYVANSYSSGSITRYDGKTGAFIDSFVSNLNNPDRIFFVPSAVPEPSGVLTISTGFLALVGLRLRRAIQGGCPAQGRRNPILPD